MVEHVAEHIETNNIHNTSSIHAVHTKCKSDQTINFYLPIMSNSQSSTSGNQSNEPPLHVPLMSLQIPWNLLPLERSKVDFHFADTNYNIHPYLDYQNCRDTYNNVISKFPDKSEQNIKRAQLAIKHGLDKIK